MPELPPDPIDNQEKQDLPFAGLLSELLQQWDCAATTEEGTPDEPDSEPAQESIGAEALLARFETHEADPVEEILIDPPEQFEPPTVESLAEALVEAEPGPVPEAEPDPEPEPASICAGEVPAPEPEPQAICVEAAPAPEPDPEPEAPTAQAFEGDGSLAALMASVEQEIRQSDAGAVTVPTSDSGRRARYITFGMAGSTYALELKHVVETDRIPRCTNVPGTPAFVRGVINLRGEVLALLELRELLDLGPCEQPGTERMLVVKTPNSSGPCGLIVDRLGGMALMDPGQLQPIRGDGSKVSLVLSGVGEHRGHLVNVIDLEELFAGSDIRELAGICV